DPIHALEWKVAPQDGVRADERRVRHTHRDGECQNGAGRYPSMSGQRSPGKPDITPEVGERVRPAYVATRLLQLIEPARRQPDLPAHLVFVVSAAYASGHFALQVVTKLRVQLPFELLSPAQPLQQIHR